MVLGGYSCFLTVLGCSVVLCVFLFFFLVVFGGSWWLLVVLSGYLWFLRVLGDSW